MMLVEITPGSDSWYNPMHICGIEKLVNYHTGEPYTRVELTNGKALTTYDSVDDVRRRINAGLRG